MSDAMHELIIAQDGGGAVMKTFHFFQPSKLYFCYIEVRNLRTQQSFMYDKYHTVVPAGDYALIFFDENRDRVATHEIHLSEDEDDTHYIVFTYHSRMGGCWAKEVSSDEYHSLFMANRLYNPLGYKGY